MRLLCDKQLVRLCGKGIVTTNKDSYYDYKSIIINCHVIIMLRIYKFKNLGSEEIRGQECFYLECQGIRFFVPKVFFKTPWSVKFVGEK